MCPSGSPARQAADRAHDLPGRCSRLVSTMTSPGPLTGRVALVTGASRRWAIGAAIVRRLVADGAAVLVHSWAAADGDRADAGGAEELVDELRAAGGRLAHLSADLADSSTPAQLVAAARESFGRLDIVIANHARSVRQSLEELTAAELDLTFAVNTRATLLLAQEFAEQYEPGPGGRIVLFTSGQYHGVMPGELPYIASKAALRELTPTLAAHLIGRGITVNCVNPGPNNTGYGDESAWAWVAERNPGGRASTPQDTARLVGWLVSDEAEWVTGQVIASDGGWSLLGA
jgi:3-oxoacyl-[acyl-carrier protein] reductase